MLYKRGKGENEEVISRVEDSARLSESVVSTGHEWICMLRLSKHTY